MLLALSSAQRAQTLHAIKIDNVRFCKDLVVIPINSLLKQTNIRSKSFSLHLKLYKEDPDLCTYTALKKYIERTKDLRNGEKQLFISFQKPHKAVSKSTISRWLKVVLEEAGIDITVFQAHSTRAASCSKAKNDNVSTDDILKTAGWSNDRTFKKFYDKIIMVDTI